MTIQGDVAVKVELQNLKRKIDDWENECFEPGDVLTRIRTWLDETIAAADSGWL